MADYNDTTGNTFHNASGSVRFNNVAIAVNKAKPSEMARDSQHAYRFGRPNPAAIIKGRRTISTCTAQVPLTSWTLFIAANPNWEDIPVEAVINYSEAGLGTFPFNHKRCQITKVTASEGDGSTTGEATVDLELLPLAVEHKGKSGSAST